MLTLFQGDQEHPWEDFPKGFLGGIAITQTKQINVGWLRRARERERLQQKQNELVVQTILNISGPVRYPKKRCSIFGRIFRTSQSSWLEQRRTTRNVSLLIILFLKCLRFTFMFDNITVRKITVISLYNNKVLFGLYKIGKESPSYTLTRHAPVIGQVQNQLFCSMNLISSGQLYM